MKGAGSVFFPLDQQLELWDKHWSEGLAKEAVWLSGAVNSFEQAEEVFARIGHGAMSASTIWQRVQKWGEGFRALEQQQQSEANRLAQKGEVGPAKSKSAVRMGVGLDGANIYIRQEGWKELKVGCVFEVALRPIFEPETREWLEQGHAINNSYVAYLGGPEVFGQRLWAAAQQRGWEQHYDTQTIGDGAPWIWNLVKLHFYDSLQTVDYYHATEPLSTAANLLYPTKPEAAERWLNRMETQLFQGIKTCVPKPITSISTIGGCSIWNFGRMVIRLAPVWSKVKPSNLRPVFVAPACAGAEREPNVSSLFGRRL